MFARPDVSRGTHYPAVFDAPLQFRATQRPQRLELNLESMFHVEHSRELGPAEKPQPFLET
jgi:hypothetical protein